MRPRIISSALLLAAAVAGTAPAQSATYSFMGGACTAAPVPFSVTGVPSLGGSFTIQTASPVLSQFTRVTPLLLTGLSNTQFGGVMLPFDLSTLTTPTLQFCGSLVTSVEVILPVPFGGELEVAVPNVPSLTGLSFYQQVLEFNFVRLSQITFVEASRGGHGVIGT